MRFIITAIATLVLTASVSAQDKPDPEISVLQAKIDSIREVRNLAEREATLAWADSVAVADSLQVIGVSFKVDSRYPQWIMVDVPLSTSTGFEFAFWLAKLAEAKNEYGAKPSGTMGRVRVRKDRAIKFLESTKNDLEIGG